MDVFIFGRVVVSWISSKQICVVRFTMKSEFITLDKARDEAEWIQNFLKDIPCQPKSGYQKATKYYV